MKTADHLNFYSTRFDTVEVDSTFYRCPTIEAVNNWALKTPPGFIFSLKVPRTITHEKILLDCDQEFEQFVDTVDVLDEKTRPDAVSIPFLRQGCLRQRRSVRREAEGIFHEVADNWWLQFRRRDSKDRKSVV